MHAYNGQPYNRTLRTSAFTNSNLTFTFVIPIILQLLQTDIKLRFAAFNLAFRIWSGYTLVLFNMIPKYLNSETVSITRFPMLIYPSQLTNIAFVLAMLIFKELTVQKVYRRMSKAYSSTGDGASRTKSSA